MCYSARVRQNLKHLSRRYEAEVDWEAFDALYRRRAEGEDIKMPRDLQRNFQNPETDVERRTATHIAQFLKAKRTEWENGVFAQKRRVAEAEESLARRETKKAREDIRIGMIPETGHKQRIRGRCCQAAGVGGEESDVRCRCLESASQHRRACQRGDRYTAWA
jgi:hypothetical protein